MSGKILIIENDPWLRENIVEMLSEEGYQCVTAENGRLGVEAALRERFRAVLCDVSMPELDGHGVLQALRQDGATATIPFLFLSARADKADIRAGMNLGADDYLTKPFTQRELLDALGARFAREERAAPRPSNAETSSDQLEKYELRRLIGQGAMGEVWEATHITLGRSVAIKFIDASFSTDPDAIERFHLEARAAARLECRNVVAVFDHGVTREGRPFLVMERLQGESLEARLVRVGRLPLATVLAITRDVARGLSLAHAAGILHRDLKPDNIFLHLGLGDDAEIAKIIDFGVAKFRDGTEPPQSTRLVGTPLYMSPEQSRGMPTDARSDLWALAVVVYRMAVGELPFSSPSFPTLAFRIWNDPAPPPSSLLPGLPPALDGWAARALAKSPEGRYQSASELVLALADALGFAPSDAIGVASPPGARASRHSLATTQPGEPGEPGLPPSSRIDPLGKTRISSPGKDESPENQAEELAAHRDVGDTQPSSTPAASPPAAPTAPPGPTAALPAAHPSVALSVDRGRQALIAALVVLVVLVAGAALAMR
jgi:serine/threonine-protein kinase